MAASLEDPYDADLSNFLVGRYARPSLRATLEGLRISDLATMDLEEFLVGVEQKDYHIARVFWVRVLTPLWEAWSAWDGLRAEREAVAVARRTVQDVIARLQGNEAREGAPPLANRGP